MGVESGGMSEEDKKRKKLSETEQETEATQVVEQQKKKSELREHMKAEEALSGLKDMMEEHNLDISESDFKTLQRATTGESLTTEEIETILDKIEEIESTQDVDKYLPKEFRITKEEYKKAITDDIARTQAITKLDTALTMLAEHAQGGSTMGLNLFSGYMAILDKRLIKIQENHIDIKENLVEIDEAKFWNKQQNMTLWQRFIAFLKEIFS